MQMAVWNSFSCMKTYIMNKILLKFVPKGPMNNYPPLIQINGLAQNRQQAIIWTNDGLTWWWIFVAFGLVELTYVSRFGYEIFVRFW